MNIKITSQIAAQGSWGIYRVNRSNGQQIGRVIRAWHVIVDGERVGTYATRDEARDGADAFRAGYVAARERHPEFAR